MRIWSLHPKYLDTKGLLAVWRETLLAQYVLAGKTKGYKNHPQLDRFKMLEFPLDGINEYLSVIFLEAQRRGYTFGKEKIDWNFRPQMLTVTNGQMRYEVEHLHRKLIVRDPVKHSEVSAQESLEQHPMFTVVEGEIETWERLAP